MHALTCQRCNKQISAKTTRKKYCDDCRKQKQHQDVVRFYQRTRCSPDLGMLAKLYTESITTRYHVTVLTTMGLPEMQQADVITGGYHLKMTLHQLDHLVESLSQSLEAFGGQGREAIKAAHQTLNSQYSPIQNGQTLSHYE